jgi:hypothetical protein
MDRFPQRLLRPLADRHGVDADDPWAVAMWFDRMGERPPREPRRPLGLPPPALEPGLTWAQRIARNTAWLDAHSYVCPEPLCGARTLVVRYRRWRRRGFTAQEWICGGCGLTQREWKKVWAWARVNKQFPSFLRRFADDDRNEWLPRGQRAALKKKLQAEVVEVLGR